MHSETGRPVLFKAIVSTLSALAFSILLSLCITLGLAVKFPPAVAVERAGVDFGMRLESLMRPASRRDDQTLPPFVFMDVGVDACEAFNGGDTLACRAGHPASPCLILDFVKAASAGGAGLVIVDLDLTPYARTPLPPICAPAPGVTLGGALEALPGQGPLIIAPLAARPDGDDPDRFVVRWADNIVGSYASGRVRLANFVVSPDSNPDGLMRRTPLTSRVATTLNGSSVLLPSVAYLAALSASPDEMTAADCVFYGQACERATASSLEHQRRIAALKGERATAPLFYSLRSLALSKAETDCADARRLDRAFSLDCLYGHVYQHHPAAQVMTASGFTPSLGYYRPEGVGAITVLGSSLPSALDHQPTPVGVMAGSEVIINAARDLFDHKALERPDEKPGALRRVGDVFGEKAAGAFAAAPVIFFSWLAIHFLMARSKGASWRRRLTARLACALTFAAALAVAGILEIRSLLPELHTASFSGERVDLLTPIFALGLEGFADASTFIIRLVEPPIERAVGSLFALISFLTTWLRRPAKESDDAPSH